MRTFAAVGLVLLLATAGLQASDHRDAPLAKANAAADINDLYAFVKGPSLIVAVTVNPFLASEARLFDPNVRYKIHVDTDGNALADMNLELRFNRSGRVSTTGNLKPLVTDLFTGRREDPFFFDLDLLSQGPIGQDTFAGADVAAIVVELNLKRLTRRGANLGIWATTHKQGVGTVDRKGRPAINTLFIAAEMKDAFNKAQPVQDKGKYGQFIPLDILTPDLLTIDTSKPTLYPNGRGLTDDVIDISLGLLGGGTDDVDGNDAEYLTAFPYLAPPHTAAAKPAAAALPAGLALEPAYPNPFNPSTQIPYNLPAAGTVSLKIYDLLGQEVRTLVDGAQAPGHYLVTWDGTDHAGHQVASGIYLYRLHMRSTAESVPFTLTRQLTLLR
ncbi:MAG: DUF4331 family protein [Chloroflexi bacterium]|nr:DUF4331 family protein [Candidatus Latescibacterota bacterium]MBI2918830.1 DUF4331 family protein [Chloroflexota bacterium]